MALRFTRPMRTECCRGDGTMEILSTDMESTKVSAGILVVAILVGSASGDAAGGHCASFTCADFSDQTLVIREDVTEDPLCTIDKIASFGEVVPCAPNVAAILLSPSHLQLRSPGRMSSKLLLEYGRDNEPGEPCFSEDEACPTPPPSVRSTDPPTTPSTIDVVIAGSVAGLSALGFLILAAGLWGTRSIRKSRYNLVTKQVQQPAPEVATSLV